MPKCTDIRSILIIGSGPIVIAKHWRDGSGMNSEREIERIVKRIAEGCQNNPCAGVEREMLS
jgi:hypothetical protein